MFASISSAVLVGAQGYPVRVEAHVGKGLPGFSIGGLPDESVREAKLDGAKTIANAELRAPKIDAECEQQRAAPVSRVAA